MYCHDKAAFLFLLATAVLPESIQSFTSVALPKTLPSTTVSSTTSLKDTLSSDNDSLYSRKKFVSIATSSILSIATTTSLSQPAFARGRATLETSYDRYTPRIIAGGEYYAKDLRDIIAKNDWAKLKDATSDPPKKTKADRAKIDGGVAERAALAGGFSDARVLVAADLYAAAFSDNSISPKTKLMKEKVENLRGVIQKLNLAAREGLGEEKEGGFFGLGAKKPSQAELAKTVRALYVEGKFVGIPSLLCNTSCNVSTLKITH